MTASFLLQQICGHHALPEREEVGVVGIDRDVNPVVERVAERFDAGEILDQQIARRSTRRMNGFSIRK